MSKTIVNLTQYSITQEIERILELYPDYPYQQTFAHPDTQQDLLVWVLNRVPNVFMSVEPNEMVVHPHAVPYCSDQQSCVEFVIRQGIQEILRQHQQEMMHHQPEKIFGQPASHWFG